MSENVIATLSAKIKSFCEERQWDQFHNPKDLAIGLCTESAELLDLFRFKSSEQIQELFNNQDSRQKIEHEVADVFFFLLRFSQMSAIDLEKALHQKMQLNGEKYPVEKAKGSNKKYTEF